MRNPSAGDCYRNLQLPFLVFFFFLHPHVGVTCKPGLPDEGKDQASVEIKVIKAGRLREGPGRGAAGNTHFTWSCSVLIRLHPRVLPMISRVKQVRRLKQNEKPVISSREGSSWLSSPRPLLPTTFFRCEQDQSTCIEGRVRPRREVSHGACVPGGACGLMHSDPTTGVARPM